MISFIGEPGNTPILEYDPASPNFGEPKIVEFPDGTLAYVYPAPDTMFIGLKGTDRLVLEIDEDQKDFFKSIESITFCRIVSGEYVPTLRVEGGALLNLQGYGFFDEISASIRKQLISKKENSYWSLLRDTAMAESDDVYKGLLFLPHAEAYGLQEIKNHHTANDRYLNGEEDGFSRIGNYSNYLNYPFDFYYGDSLFKSPDLIEILEKNFERVKSYVYYGSLPLIDEDPSSVTFGEPMIKTDKDGTRHFVYDKYDQIVWLEYTPKLYLYSTFNIVDGQLGLMNEKLIHFQDKGTSETIVADHYLDDYWRGQFGTMFDSFDWQSWYEEYFKNLQGREKYDLTNSKHCKKMNMSDSYWV